jgi:hypothetical protein
VSLGGYSKLNPSCPFNLCKINNKLSIRKRKGSMPELTPEPDSTGGANQKKKAFLSKQIIN